MSIAAVPDRRDPDWHAWRAQGIGSSDVAAIAGLSPFASPFSTYLIKRGEIPEPDLSDSPVVELGKRLEPVMADWFHDRTGLHIVGEQTLCVHPEHDHHRCTVDGFVAESPASTPDAALGVSEMKVTGDSALEWADAIPDKYAIQGQWQLHVTGQERLWYPVIHRHSGRFEVYTLERDDSVIAELVRIADEFWRRVQEGEPPAIDGHAATTSALKAAYPDAFEETVELPAHLVEQRAVLKGRILAAEAELTAVENQIKATLGDAAYGEVGGRQVVTYKTQDRTTVDAKRLKAEAPDTYSQFARTSTLRVLRVKDPKE